MSIELIQAAQQALSALEKSQPHPSNPVIGLTNQDFIDHEDTIRQLRTAIQQAEAQKPATGEPGAWSEREQLRHAQAAVVMPMIGPLLDAWENSDREVMSQEPELSKQLKNINSAMEDADTHPAPSAPDDVVEDGIRNAEDELNCAEEVLDAITCEFSDGEFPVTDFNCIGDYITAVVDVFKERLAAQQPATGEPVAWNSIQIASWIGSQLMHEPSMFERATVCKFVRSLGRHPTLIKHSPKTHPAPSVPADVVLDCYDAGILNDFGGGNVEWWQDYIRAELGNAHDFYQSQIAHHGASR